MIAVIFVSVGVSLFRVAQIYVDRRLAFPTQPPKIVLVNRPPWMSDFLAEQIIKTAQPIGLHSTFDRQLLIDTANALQSNPWVRHVNLVRRVYGDSPGDTVEIDCDYRAPVGLVKWGDFFWLVDGDAIKLPEQYTAEQLPKIMLSPDGQINVRIIDGITHAPPESGRRWPGDDLAAGLELAKLLADKDFTEQIRLIDVSNFGGRKDNSAAQIVLVTQFDTQIRWGQPPSAKDSFVEVPASVKLANLKSIFEEHHRVDADQPWIDVRFDRVTCPATDIHAADASGK
jgi:hypothetical protein